MTRYLVNFGLFLVGVTASQICLADALNPGEGLGPSLYNFNFGTQGAGNSTLAGTGMSGFGAYDSGPTYAFSRFYDGQPGGTQAPGTLDIAYKRNEGGDIENINAHVPVNGPAVGGSLPGGGSFDGTALWIAHSVFLDGQAPPLGTASGPGGSGTTGTKPDGVTVRPADGGIDFIGTGPAVIQVPVVTGQVTQQSYLFSAHVFRPDHAADGASQTGFAVGLSVDREGFGLFGIGGTQDSTRFFNPSAGTWHLAQVRAEVTTNGGVLAGSSDDTGSQVTRFFLDGVELGAPSIGIYDPTWMTSRTGPVEVQPFFGLQRGWQGSAAEAFADNLTASLIVPVPEPTAAALLTIGCLLLARRRSR